MSARLSRFALTLISLLLVLWLVMRDLEKTNPGPMSAVHAKVTNLLGGPDCEACHGDGKQANSLALACLECHAPILEQRQTSSGLHGTLGAKLKDACGKCHAEHHGLEFRLADDLAFRVAGFEGRDAFDHSTMAEPLEGRHRELGCLDCHEHADTTVLAKDQLRYLGLESSCIACHEDTHKGEMGEDCTSCHGQQFPFDEVASFNHTRDFPLEDVHARIACAECHAQTGPTSVPEEQRNPLATRDCIECHDSPHLASFSPDVEDCASCHGLNQGSFLSARERFTKEQHADCGFLLSNPHQEASCSDCHGSDDAPYATRFPGRAADSCASCHEDPHRDQFLLAGATETDCLECHRRDAFLPSLFDEARHAKTAFPLDGAHLEAACTDCHRAPTEPPQSADSYLLYRNTETTCAACHSDPHDGSFDAVAARLQLDDGCITCHGTASFAPTEREFDHGVWTGFPLVEAHEQAECSSCHRPLTEADAKGRSFAPVNALFPQHSLCSDCHEDPHHGRFDAKNLPQEIAERVSCERCHSQTDFAALEARDFDHALWTGYPLEGAHAQSTCFACHGEESGPIANADRCDTCHQDPHGQAFRGRVPATLNGQASCARCHGTSSFRIQDQGFDHGRFTSFRLDGAHAEVHCSGCHAPQPRSRTDGRSFARALGTDCAGCHGDPHAGQFRGRKDCADCHGLSGDFTLGLTFDHDRDSAFPLDEAHVDLACASCHRAYPLPDGGSVTRYRPLGTTCKDCHGFR